MQMNWKNEPPKTTGPYLWRKTVMGNISVTVVMVGKLDGVFNILIPSDATHEDEYVDVEIIGGEWIRLVPAND